MKSKLSLIVCGLLGSAIPGLGEWQLFENFENGLDAWFFSDPNQNCESFEPNFCDGVREIVVDPVMGGTNMVGKFKAARDNVVTNWTSVNAIALPEVASGNTSFTYYMKFAVADFRMNTVFGLMSETAENVTNAYDIYESILAVRTTSGGKIEFRDFDVYLVGSADPVEVYTWYEVWLVHDNADLSYDIYIKGGDEFPEQTLMYESALYRAGIGEVASFAILTGTGPADAPDGNSDLYIDDLSIDYSGENLSTPEGDPGGGETWGGYDVTPDKDANTENFLGWINVISKPWIWSYSLNKYIYAPEPESDSAGGWAYVGK